MNNSLPVYRARWRDIPDIVDLVVDPFARSTVGAWLVPDERRRHDVLRAVVRVWVEHALLFGEAHLLQDRSAAAVWLHRYGPVPPPSGYGERLAVACGDYLDRFLHLDDVLRTHRPAGPHHHLAFLAVAPGPRHLRRVAPLLATSDARPGQARLPAYAEATTAADRDLYARNGYLAREPFSLPDGTIAYPMWHSPGRKRPDHSSATPAGRPDGPRRSRRIKDLPIRMVLDTSAIIAFTKGSIAVGEAIAETSAKGCLFGLPVMCLAEASRSVVDASRLALLVNHPAAAVLTIDPFDWQSLAATYRAVGRLDTASALLAAGDDCVVLSDQPGR